MNNNKNLFVKWTSFILVIAMLNIIACNIYVVSASTDEATTAEGDISINNKATLSIDYLGIGSAPDEIGKEKAGLTTNDIGSEFWIGVAIDEFSEVSVVKNGIHTLEIGFDYDPRYVVPFESDTITWEKAVISGNLKSGEGVDNQDSAWWSDSYYEVKSAVSNGDVNTNSLREELSQAQLHKESGWASCFVSIIKKSDTDASELRFLNATAQKSYILKIPFKLVSAPDKSDENQTPIVINMSRGPETFVIGSGTDGTEPYGAWESQIMGDEEDAHNLKTMFEFGGDISLFGGSDELDKLEVYKGNPDEGEEAEKYDLSLTNKLNKDGFFQDEYSYYLRVPNETDSVRLVMTKDTQPDVYVNENSVSVKKIEKTDSSTGDGGTDSTQFEAIVPLDEFNSAINGGFSEDIKIKSGNVEYHVYVQRLLKPKIELEYGNSPYGEIMRDDNITDKDQAKAAFNENNKYSADYLPTAVEDKSNITYTTEAWGGSTDPDVNMDRNEYAIFAYEGTPFSDTGFTATDSLGNAVDASEVTRTIEIKRLTGNNISEVMTDDHKETITLTPGDNSLEAIVDPTKNLVRPGVYELNYSFTDEPTGDQIPPIIRKIIVLPLLGDVNMIDGVNNSDTVPINSYVQGGGNIVDAEKAGDIKNLFEYRVCDMNMIDGVNNSDTVPINSYVQGIGQIIGFYRTVE